MKPRSMSRGARWKLATIACGLALLTAGCGSSSSASSSASTASSGTASSAAASAAASASDSALCADAATLRTSLDNLRNINVGTGAVSQIRANLSDVSTALTTLVSNAHGQWQAQTSALSTALSKLGTAVSDLAAHPGASTVSGAVTAIRGVTTAGQNLLAALNTTCPSASASPAST
jgi:hypothetical protein